MIDIKKYIADSIAKVKQNPGTIFGFLYPYILVLLVTVGLIYSSNLGNVAKQKIPVLISDTTDTTDTKDLALTPAKTIPPIDIKKVLEPNPEILEMGKQLYTTNCASCHNTTGAGGGPASVGLNPAPRNFTSNDGWKNGRTISGIYSTLQEGIQGSAMISYDFLKPEEKIALAHYIRIEFITDPPKSSIDELEILDQTYNLSAGMDVPAQIPVKSAKDILIKETSQKIQLIDQAIDKINSDARNGAKIFLQVTSGKETALSTLIINSEWKSGQNNFIKFVAQNVITNGFKGNILLLSNSEQSELYNYLKELL